MEKASHELLKVTNNISYSYQPLLLQDMHLQIQTTRSVSDMQQKKNFSDENVTSHQIQLVKYALKPFLIDTLITTNLLLRENFCRSKLISSLPM